MTKFLILIFSFLLVACVGGVSTKECINCSVWVYDGKVFKDKLFGEDADMERVARAYCAENGMGEPQLGPANYVGYDTYKFINCSPAPKLIDLSNHEDKQKLFNQCESLGFKEGTPDFGNCMLKLIEIENNKILQLKSNSSQDYQNFKSDQTQRDLKTQKAIDNLKQYVEPSNTNKTQLSTAFLKKQYVSGVNRICIYERLGSEDIITIEATSICPLTR